MKITKISGVILKNDGVIKNCWLQQIFWVFFLKEIMQGYYHTKFNKYSIFLTTIR